MARKLRKSMTDVAIRMRDFKVPYQLKKLAIRPVLLGLGSAIVDLGEVAVTGLGRFYVYRKRVSTHFASKEKHMKYKVAFKPYKSFLKRVEDRWNRPVELKIVEEPSHVESVVSVDGKASAE